MEHCQNSGETSQNGKSYSSSFLLQCVSFVTKECKHFLFDWQGNTVTDIIKI